MNNKNQKYAHVFFNQYYKEGGWKLNKAVLEEHKIRIKELEYKIKKYGNNLKILDIGCGNSILGKYLKKNNRIYGLDISTYVLQKAKNNYSFTVCGDAIKLPFKDNSFDIIVTIGVINYLDNCSLFFKEINRVLKFYGKLFFVSATIRSIPNKLRIFLFKSIKKHSPGLFLNDQLFWESKYYSIHEIRQFIRDTNFIIEKEEKNTVPLSLLGIKWSKFAKINYQLGKLFPFLAVGVIITCSKKDGIVNLKYRANDIPFHPFIRFLFHLMCFIFYYSGIIYIMNNIKLLNNGIHILMYHKISKNSSNIFDPYYMIEDEKRFITQMNYLKKYFKIISLNQSVYKIKNREKIDNGYAVITFDDGYNSILKYLEKIFIPHRIPATVFLITNWIEKKEPFWIEVIMESMKEFKKKGKLRFFFKESDKLKSKNDLYHASRHFIHYSKSSGEKYRNEIMDMLLGSIQGIKEKINNRSLTWSEINNIHQSGIEIGSHSIAHRELSECTLKDIIKELTGSKRVIEQQIKKPINAFSYPFGGNSESYSRMKKPFIKSQYQCAVSGQHGVNLNNIDLFNLKRIRPTDDPIYVFSFRLSILYRILLNLKSSAVNFINYFKKINNK